MLLNEARGSSEEKLTHLEHAEDHAINAGGDGYTHAKNSLQAVHGALTGNPQTNASVTTKYDGSPSIVFGHHPETGKFFVASKSAFNKNPKINYTEDDIEANHGHAPGLVEKLKSALKHLPKVTPKEGVFQGDVMHSGVKSKSNPNGDVEMKDGVAHFKPNTITYTAPDDETDAVKKSKFGVAVHTSYHGPTFDQMKANFNTDVGNFKSNKDVHMINVHHDMSGVEYTPAQKEAFNTYMGNAESAHKKLAKGGYDAVGDDRHTDLLKTYINKTVRDGSQPSVEGYQSHLQNEGEKAAGKVKTLATQEKRRGEYSGMVNDVESNKDHFSNLLDLHSNLQQAKNQLTHALSSHSRYGHFIGDKETKPEGFVVSLNNRPTKLVDRAEFSRANFAKNAQ